MTLPNITIPQVNLPIDIPVLMHPALVHFAIAIPVVVLLLEIINLVAKKRALSVFSLFLLIVVAISMVAVYFTGITDGKEAFDLLSPEGKEALKEHKLIGIYLVYISGAMVLLKLLFMLFSRVVAKLFFILLLIGFITLILIQGKEGGELVYKYGANNEAVTNIISDKEDLQDEYDELKEKLESQEPKAKEAETKKEPKATESEAKEEQKATEPEAKEEPKATESEAKEEPKATEPEAKEEQKTTEPEAKEEQKATEAEAKEEPKATEAETKKEESKAVSLEIPEDSVSQTN